MTATPGATPETRPLEEPTEAADGLLLVHMPPAGVLVSIVEPPTHNEGLPDIGEGPVVTVTTVVAWQPVARLYVIIAVPVATPVTTPDADTVATEGLVLLQAPPGVALDNVSEPPTQTLPLPVMGDGPAFTVTTTVAVQPPAV